MNNTVVVAARRTGSTILQNIAHIILTGKKGVIPKNHHNVSFTPNTKVIVPVRDPRDTALSIYRTVISNQENVTAVNDINIFKSHVISTDLNLMSTLYNLHKNRENSLIVRYEDVYQKELGDYTKITKVLCDFLEVKNTPQLNEIITTELNIDKMKKVSDTLGTFKKWDNDLETGFCIHGNHIESKTILSWKDRVDASIIDSLNQLYKPLILNLGYEI